MTTEETRLAAIVAKFAVMNDPEAVDQLLSDLAPEEEARVRWEALRILATFAAHYAVGLGRPLYREINTVIAGRINPA